MTPPLYYISLLGNFHVHYYHYYCNSSLIGEKKITLEFNLQINLYIMHVTTCIVAETSVCFPEGYVTQQRTVAIEIAASPVENCVFVSPVIQRCIKKKKSAGV